MRRGITSAGHPAPRSDLDSRPPASRFSCSCITCGDEALALKVVKVDAERCLALCENDSGERESVEIALVDPVVPGDGLLVHAGTAIANLPREAVGV